MATWTIGSGTVGFATHQTPLCGPFLWGPGGEGGGGYTIGGRYTCGGLGIGTLLGGLGPCFVGLRLCGGLGTRE